MSQKRTMQSPSSQNPSNVLVVGASGMVGEKIVHELTCGSQKNLFKVTAVVPKGEAKSKLHECPCSVIECSANTVDEVTSCLKDKHIRQAVLAIRAGDHTVESVSHWLDGLKSINCEYVLMLSEPAADKSDTVWGKQFYQLEQKLLNQTEIDYTILRSMFFVDNLIFYDHELKRNKRLALPLGKKGYFAPIHSVDVARAVALILSDCQKHHGKTYELTGPKTKNGSGLAKAMTKVLGHEIEYKECSVNELVQQLKTHNLPQETIDGIVSFYDAANRSQMYYVTGDYKMITGEDPHKIQDFIQQHRQCFMVEREQ